MLGCLRTAKASDGEMHVEVQNPNRCVDERWFMASDVSNIAALTNLLSINAAIERLMWATGNE
jgi:methyl-accepting chemotaxis protein